MDDNVLFAIACTIFASSGFWSFVIAIMNNKSSRKSAESKMLLGLGHEKIMDRGKEYISRGYITADEYEDLDHYLFQPYEAMGGNGSAKRIMDEVKKLPIK